MCVCVLAEPPRNQNINTTGSKSNGVAEISASRIAVDGVSPEIT